MTTKDLESKLSRRPESPLFARLASEYLAEHRIAEAKEICMTGLQRFPLYATAHLILSRCYTAESDYPSALAALEQAQSLLSDSTVVKDFHETLLDLIPDFSPPREENTDIPENENSPEAIEPSIPISESPLTAILEENDSDNAIAETLPETILNETETITDSPDDETVDRGPAQLSVETPEENIVEPDQEKPDDVQVEFFQSSVQTEIEEPSIEPINEPSGEDRISENVIPSPDRLLEPAVEIFEELPPQQISSPEIVPEEIPLEADKNIPLVPQEPILIGSQPSLAQKNVSDAGDSDDTRIVSKTLAEIYASQGAYDEAIITYRLLKEFRPARSSEYDTRIAELENLRQQKTKE